MKTAFTHYKRNGLSFDGQICDAFGCELADIEHLHVYGNTGTITVCGAGWDWILKGDTIRFIPAE